MQLNHGDLSPNFSGTLFGISNMLANCSGFIAPYIFGYVTNDSVMKLV